jgi:H+/gluconate symporter-like permease
VTVKDGPKKTRRQWFATEPAAPGTKRWYREKRIDHIPMWFLPATPVLYTVASQGVSMPWPILVTMLLPVVGSSIALVFVCHALWRIEINVAGNREHPFTEKDGRVLNRSGKILLTSILFAVIVNHVAHFVVFDGTPDAHLRFIDTAVNTAVIVGFVSAVLGSTMRRIHCKAKHAYDELEKGV